MISFITFRRERSTCLPHVPDEWENVRSPEKHQTDVEISPAIKRIIISYPITFWKRELSVEMLFPSVYSLIIFIIRTAFSSWLSHSTFHSSLNSLVNMLSYIYSRKCFSFIFGMVGEVVRDTAESRPGLVLMKQNLTCQSTVYIIIKILSGKRIIILILCLYFFGI